jgi:hypothetical protein
LRALLHYAALPLVPLFLLLSLQQQVRYGGGVIIFGFAMLTMCRAVVMLSVCSTLAIVQEECASSAALRFT